MENNTLHALTQVNSQGAIALIWGASPQVRSDRRKDRVEVKPEQLAAASAQAEMSIIYFTLLFFLLMFISREVISEFACST